MNKTPDQFGFTLIELMITLGIAGILFGIALPNFSSVMLNAARTNVTNEFALAMTYARTEAVKRGMTVTVCSRSTDTACSAGANWDKGWLVFVDVNGNGSVDNPGVTDQILKVHEALPGNHSLRAGTLPRVSFKNTGFSPGFSDTFRLCDIRGASQGKSIAVSLQGRLRTQTGTTACP